VAVPTQTRTNDCLANTGSELFASVPSFITCVYNFNMHFLLH